MIWPFRRRSGGPDDDAGDDGAAASPPVDAPLAGAGDPLSGYRAPAAGSPQPPGGAGAARTYGTPRPPAAPGPNPGASPAASPRRAAAHPGAVAGIPARAHRDENGRVVLPGGVLAGGLKPPSPGAEPGEIEAFLHAVRAMHGIDSPPRPGARPAAPGMHPAAAAYARAAMPSPVAGVPAPPAATPVQDPSTAAPVVAPVLAPRDVPREGLPRPSGARWYAVGTPIVMARGLVAAAGTRRLAPLDVTLAAGERWGVLGANGAGKTTLLRTLAGLHAPVAGALEWAGVPATKLDAAHWARHCGFLPTVVPEPFDETVRARVARIGAPAERIDAALATVGLTALAGRQWSSLSSGERQRAWVAFVLAGNSDALLLDEPLAHQDPRECLRLADAFAAESRQGRLVVVTAHDPDWVLGHCTHALVICADGSAVHGAAERVLRPQVLAAAYAVPWRRIDVGGRPALVPGR